MPSQNLPKPNIPTQNNTASPGSTPPKDVFTAQNKQSVPQPVMPQSVPGGLSRENPGGTPPGMKIQAPEGSLDIKKPVEQAPAPPTQSTSTSPELNSLAKTEAAPMAAPKIERKASPIAQAPKAAAPLTPSPAGQAPAKAATPATAGSATKKPAAPGKKKISLPVMIAAGVLLLAIIGFGIFQVIGGGSSSKNSSKSNTAAPAANTAEETGTVTTTEPVSLTYWGLWEDSQIIEEVISNFEEKNPNVTIDYRKQSHRDYRERLQQAISSGNGPDIFRFHSTWGVMMPEALAVLPATVMSPTEYENTFYPVAYEQLQYNGQIFGIPLMYEGLALLYNKEMLKTANLTVPSTWSDLRNAANQLTVPSNPSDRKATNITRGGLAIGNAGNVDHFSDILALLILQNGGDPGEADSQYVKDAITFYTNFIKQDKVWSDRLPNSTVAFARGEVAMIFAPSWRIHDIKDLNPDLDFGVAPVPQLDASNPIAWASYWAEGVSDQSENQEVAWQFLKHLSSAEVLKQFYADASKVRTFGELYSRQDMAAELSSDELVSAYLEDATIAQSWYMASFTHDNGINDQIIKYYEDAVNEVLTGKNVEQVLETTVEGVSEVLTKYNLQ